MRARHGPHRGLRPAPRASGGRPASSSAGAPQAGAIRSYLSRLARDNQFSGAVRAGLGRSVAVGVIAALIILLVAFGAVALTMASALTFLPAMLGFLGPKVLSRRER